MTNPQADLKKPVLLECDLSEFGPHLLALQLILNLDLS